MDNSQFEQNLIDNYQRFGKMEIPLCSIRAETNAKKPFKKIPSSKKRKKMYCFEMTSCATSYS